MIRPAERLEEARALLAVKPNVDPGTLALADQFGAQADEALSDYRAAAVGDAPPRQKIVGERSVAFTLAAMEAMQERLAEPSGRMCPHMVDLRVPHKLDLGLGVVSCPECVDLITHGATCWSSDRCDVCGKDVGDDGRFVGLTFTLGAGLAFADVCEECGQFVGIID